MRGDPRLDPVGVAFAQLLGPGAVSRLELAGRVALDVPGQLLELDPEEPGTVRRPRRIHRQRLADDDGRLHRQEPTVGLVHRPRDAVEPRRQVDDRRACEAVVSLPPRPLRQREMDLHVGAPVPEPPAALAEGRRRLFFEQAPVELRGCHVCDHCFGGRHGLAAREADADRLAFAHEDALDIPPRLADAAVVANQLHERVDEPRPAPSRDRHPALLDRDGDDLGHEAGQRRVGPEPGVQHPRHEQPVRRLGREGAGQPVAARGEHVPRELGEATAPEAAIRLHPEREPVPRPKLGPEDTEGQIGVREEIAEHPPPGGTVACGMTVELLRVRIRAPEQERRLAVRRERRRRIVGVQILEPTRRELLAELRVRRAPKPERMPGAEGVVQEPWLGELRGLDRTPEVPAALEHADVPPGPRQQRRARQRVDAAADEDRVVVSHDAIVCGPTRSGAADCSRSPGLRRNIAVARVDEAEERVTEEPSSGEP